MDLSTVRSREKLVARREPFWHKLATGQFLGYRPSKVGKGGNWIARYYDSETQRQHLRALGDWGHLPQSERFSAASAEAREWFAHLSEGGATAAISVRQACEQYAVTNSDAAKRFPRYVYGDPIAKVLLHKLSREHVRSWRERLTKRPALVTRTKVGAATTRPRAAATINRDMVCLRAALNLALDRGQVLTNRAWRVPLKPLTAGARRRVYLDRDQRRALLAALPDDLRAFAHALCLLPLRPGALAALCVRDFDARRSELSIGKDKSGQDRKLLLPPVTASMFKAQTRLKMPGAPLFARINGSAWSKDAWKWPFKDAARNAGLPEDATAYALRHSTITDLITGGLDLMTTAEIAGTSVRMIEAHYKHLSREQAARALAGLGL